MFRLAIKNLAANKIRLGLTALAIVLGVGFVVSSFVLRDGLKDSFAGLSEEIVGDTDIGIEPVDLVGDPLTDADLETVRATSGVRIAEGFVDSENSIQPIRSDGSTISTNGPPQIGFNWGFEDQLNPAEIVDGRSPENPDEWVVDLDAAKDNDFEIGTTYEFVTVDGRKSATLVGTFRFGEDNTTNGATLMGFELSTIREWLQLENTFNNISIGIDGSVPVAELQAALGAALGNPTTTGGADEVLDGRVIVSDQADLLADQQGEFNFFIDIFGYVLLGFALIALFVSIFIIANTFAIVTGQRVRELGLLRAVGATPAQIRRSVLLESSVIGLVASAIGLAAGVGIAFFMRWVLNLIGFSLPSFPIVLAPLTIITAFVVGTIVTVASAIVPAFTASRISPITAIRGTTEESEKSIARYVIGGAISLVGASLIGFGLFAGDGALQILVPLGAGAAILFIGLTALSPIAAGPLSRVLGMPLGPIFKRPGSLATQNAARNPRRTATTAAALMIGLALVSMAMVLGDSFKAEFSKIIDSTIQADYIISGDNANVPLEIVDRMDDDPTYADVSPAFYWDASFETVRPDGGQGDTLTSADVAAFDYTTIDTLMNLEVTEGDLTAMNNDRVAIRTSIVEDYGFGLGDTIAMVLSDGTLADMEVVAIFDESAFSSPVLITEDRFFQISEQKTADLIFAARNPEVTVEDADAAFAVLGSEYPNLGFESAAGFRETVTGFIDATLNVLTVLLALAIFIALLGIANTMALSVFERTREIGLLRAVGMTRRQTRRMIRWESAIIAAVGAVFGALIGGGLGVLTVTAIPDDIISSFSIPWLRIGLMVAVASFAGLIAAFAPAFRASRMDVLEAISHE